MSSADKGVSRRDFVKASAAAIAVPLTAAEFARGNWRHPRGADTIRIGLIGCGGRGTGAAVQSLRADPGTVLVAMGDVFQDRLDSSLEGIKGELADKASEKVQVPAERRFVGLDNYQRVIDSGVDMVLLTSYPYFRPAHLKAAIDAGKHVFAEKPIAVDAPGVRTVLECGEAAKKKNLALLIGFCWRYNAGMRAAFEKVNSGIVGDVVTAHTTYLGGTLGKRPRQPGWTDAEFQMRNWWHFTWLAGDHIVEQAIHSVDRMAWAMNDKTPKLVNCLGGRAARSGPEHGNVYDHFAAVYEYDDGRRCFHTCRQMDNCPGDNTDYIYGPKGSMTVNGWTPTYAAKDYAGKSLWSHSGDIKDMYQQEHDELFASIRAGTPINDCQRGAYSTLMAIMARMSAYTGQTITWDQAMNSKEVLGPEKLEFGPLPTPPVAIPGQTKFV